MIILNVFLLEGDKNGARAPCPHGKNLQKNLPYELRNQAHQGQRHLIDIT
jgi:hypothetical protein